MGTHVMSRLESLRPGEMDARLDIAAGVFTLLVCGEPAALSDVLPVLHSLGFVVLDERPTAHLTAAGAAAWSYEFRIRTEAAPRADQEDVVVDAFRAVWSGRAEADPFNVLVPRLGLRWREAALLRVYARFLKQAGLPFSSAQVVRVLERHDGVTRRLVRLFGSLLDPDRIDAVAAAETEDRIRADIEGVPGIDDDRILRAFLSLVLSTVRTDFFRVADDGSPGPVITVKLDSGGIPELPEPRPLFETFVYGPDVEGTHLRFSRVARGGLRWSDRIDDYRTEVLGLVRTQMVKNAIIVPAGAKGVFIAKRGEGADCYRIFVSALLGVTDNLDSAQASVVPPARVVCRDGSDSYLVVAADRGTAGFSDVANDVAAARGFWLGDAFASGGSVGYDHKAIGITAKGAWESARRHFRERGMDADTDPLTAVGIGDMGGDVFGNGMLLSSRIRLVAAFDHRHIFLDPAPDPARSHAERVRLFHLPRSSWADYDRASISAGGGVWPRTAKSIPISAEAAEALGLAGASSLSSRELIRAILRAPVDLLWNGGIGTFVKAQAETSLDVHDKSNDDLRIDAGEVRARVVVEGGNLGITPRARIELAQAGHGVNSDAWDNSAGVDCSDHEVNIKILLDSAVARGGLDAPARDRLLADMTPDVVELVLAENRAQNELLGTTRAQAAELMDTHGRLIGDLEARGILNRTLEALPDDEDIQQRLERGAGLTSPELAALAAHVKLSLKADLLSSDVLDADELLPRLQAYFPSELRRRFPVELARHPLRREILATALTNELVDTGGVAFVFRIAEASGASTPDIVRAYVAAHSVFDVPRLLAGIRFAANTRVSDAFTREVRRLLERATRWLLAQRPQPVDMAAETERYRDGIRSMSRLVPHLLGGADAEIVEQRMREVVDQGATVAQAREVMTLLHRFCLLDVIDVAALTGVDRERVARLYYRINAHLQVDHLLTAVSALPQRERWDTQARLLLRGDIYRAVKAVCVDVLLGADHTDDIDALIARWEESHRSRVSRARTTLREISRATPPGWTTLDVAVRVFGGMASAAAYSPHPAAR
ncbi:MAG: NAD-glutamate dehydrogenase [Microbacterium sp.]|uniref:NAD-glutamate dehydrogenase domain-containing protein n=1 Tax=Microbacterium sp. TaxID=51671 RepID=UPI0039E71BCB